MAYRYLLGHLLITSACSSKPARRGAVFCSAQVKCEWPEIFLES